MITRRIVRSELLMAAAAVVLTACASGAEGTGNGDDVVTIDARSADAPVNPNPDASVTDAPLPITDARIVDAPISLPDASIGLDGGVPGTCTVDSECPSAECCLLALCVPGTRTGLPAPLNCSPS
ncbi:MAG: hypothetical protein R3B06_18615 [Kofleriaceae bacterium]